MHGRDADAHAETANENGPLRHLGPARDEERETGGGDRGDDRGDQEPDPVTDRRRQPQREHRNEMHAPDAGAHRRRAAQTPRDLLPSRRRGLARRGKARGQIKGDIRSENRDDDRDHDQAPGVLRLHEM
jgi:hypothetical protein